MNFAILLFVVTAIPLISSAQFSRNLHTGLRNDADVVRLQEFLRAQKFYTYPIVTGNYFTQTLFAVRDFQRAHNLPVSGYFGPLTRIVANRLLTKTLPSSKPATVESASSPYQGKIIIRSVSGSSKNPLYERVTLENTNGKETISVTGFTIENSLGSRFIIPKGHVVPGFDALASDPILLRPHERAIITAGEQEKRMNFRTNICIGYFNEISKFTPSLSSACPGPDTSLLLHLSDRCLNFIQSIGMCRTAGALTPPDSVCSAYVNENLNYAGCVRNNRARPDFYGNTWFIWMQYRDEFFRNIHDMVILRDEAGREVDRYSY